MRYTNAVYYCYYFDYYFLFSFDLGSAQQYFIVAPNVIRVDVEESVLINLEGIPQNAVVQVTLYFQMTGSNERLSEKRVHVKGISVQCHR